MDNVEQNNTLVKQNPFSTVTTLSKVLAMLLFILLPFIGFYAGMRYQKFINVTPVTECEQAIPKQVISKEISVRIEPYTVETDGQENYFVIQLTNLNEQVDIDKVIVWTDKEGACKRITQDFTEFIRIPKKNYSTYVFLQFVSTGGHWSQIYATADYPIFQCGNLVE